MFYKRYPDGFRTVTNPELNAYRARLDEKLHKLYDKKEKWYYVNGAWILTEQSNILRNPNGDWKWNGWEVVGVKYSVWVFDEDDVKVAGDQKQAHGKALAVKVFENDRDGANEYFKWAKEELGRG